MQSILLLVSMFIIACGEGVVSITNESFESRIVVEGFIFPHQRVEKIRITKNFRVNSDLTNLDLLIRDADVKIIDESTGKEYMLDFHSSDIITMNYYEYKGDSLIIDYGNSYTLDVTATVDGKILHTKSTTIVPAKGFKITNLNHSSLPYRQRDRNDEVIKFQLEIERSPETTFYVNTIRPLVANSDNFIYDNPFEDKDSDEVDEDINDFNYRFGWIQDTPPTVGQSKIDLFWFDLWFYTSYDVIVYAADRNYKEFFQTYNEVQEQDGNFHEPIFNLEGDGIGVFGSVIADTVSIEVVP